MVSSPSALKHQHHNIIYLCPSCICSSQKSQQTQWVQCIFCSDILPFSFSGEGEDSREMSMKSKKSPETMGDHSEKWTNRWKETEEEKKTKKTWNGRKSGALAIQTTLKTFLFPMLLQLSSIYPVIFFIYPSIFLVTIFTYKVLNSFYTNPALTGYKWYSKNP